jgi:hypothetical protein
MGVYTRKTCTGNAGVPENAEGTGRRWRVVPLCEIGISCNYIVNK